MESYSDFESSNVARLAFDPQTSEVFVTFKGKDGKTTSTWCYWPVSRADFDAIHHAPSVGSAVNRNLVRGGLYSSRKVE